MLLLQSLLQLLQLWLPLCAAARHCGDCILWRLAAKQPTSLEAVRSALEGLRSSLERQLADRHAV